MSGYEPSALELELLLKLRKTLVEVKEAAAHLEDLRRLAAAQPATDSVHRVILMTRRQVAAAVYEQNIAVDDRSALEFTSDPARGLMKEGLDAHRENQRLGDLVITLRFLFLAPSFVFNRRLGSCRGAERAAS